jgi:hypothetical protein
MKDKNKEPAKVKGLNYYEFEKDYRSDLDQHDNYIADFDAYEAMLVSKTYDSVSRQTKNGITDSDAATMIIERSARVVGQLPDGEVVAAGKKDKGKAAFMDILRQKWIYPNANAQRPFLDKLRLWEQYSGVYGYMPMYYDWEVNESTGYVGPNCWLWNPRNFVPQQGRYTIADMDYCHAISYMGKREIESLIENWTEESGWDKDNLTELLEMSKNSKKSSDTKRDSYVARQRNQDDVSDRIQVVTRFEAGDDGRWITFAPEHAHLQLRSIENPHKSGKIPFVIKPAIPLVDSFYNLSDMARAKPIQFAKDGLTNFYFQGIKMNIYPPTVVNAQGILKHTISNEPGAIWEEIIANSARRLETSTAGLATYQAAMGQMAGALQNVFGTTTTQVNAAQAMDPAFGKTPEAIKYQSGRESSRDNQNRAYLQAAIEELMEGMMSLIPVMGTEKIPVDLFSDDIKEIKDMGYDDILELIKPNESQQSGRLIIDPKKLDGVEYRFNMKPDSTIKMDKDQQRQNLLEVMEVLGQNANVLQSIQESTGKMPNWEQMLTSYITLADIPGMDQPFVSAPQPQNAEDHPVMKLIDTLNIKFESLPEDSKQKILEMIGAPTQQASPTQQNIDLKTADAHTRAVGQGMAMTQANQAADPTHPMNQPPTPAVESPTEGPDAEGFSRHFTRTAQFSTSPCLC